MKNFLSAETTAKRALSSYHAEKKTPTSPNISIFPILKDAVHAPDMQHHLVNSVLNTQTPWIFNK